MLRAQSASRWLAADTGEVRSTFIFAEMMAGFVMIGRDAASSFNTITDRPSASTAVRKHAIVAAMTTRRRCPILALVLSSAMCVCLCCQETSGHCR